jgi:hypothetical protein
LEESDEGEDAENDYTILINNDPANLTPNNMSKRLKSPRDEDELMINEEIKNLDFDNFGYKA